MKNKIILIFLIIVLSLLIVCCSGNNETNNVNNETNNEDSDDATGSIYPKYLEGDAQNFIIRNESGKTLYVFMEYEGTTYSLGKVQSTIRGSKTFKIKYEGSGGGDVRTFLASTTNDAENVLTNWVTPIYKTENDPVMWRIDKLSDKPLDPDNPQPMNGTIKFKYFPDYKHSDIAYNITLWSGGEGAGAGGEEIANISPNKSFSLSHPFEDRIKFFAEYWYIRDGVELQKWHDLGIEKILTIDYDNINVPLPREDSVDAPVTDEYGNVKPQGWVKIINTRPGIVIIKDMDENKKINEVASAGSGSHLANGNETKYYRVDAGEHRFAAFDYSSERQVDEITVEIEEGDKKQAYVWEIK